MKRVQLIAIDMDGTLLLSDHRTIPEENIAAIRRAQACGVTVCINTGRMLEDASDFLRRYGLDCMVISGDGTRVCTGPAGKGEVIFQQNLAEADALQAIDFCLASGLTIHAFEDGVVNSVLGENGTPYHVLEREGILSARYGEDALREAASRGLMKIFVVTEGFAGSVFSEKIPQLQRQLKAVLPHLELASSGAGNIEIVSEKAGKGRALEVLAQRLGIDRFAVMAIGDAENDMSMLEYAYHSVAMANARGHVREVCRYHTRSNDECGVARMIDQVLAAKKA